MRGFRAKWRAGGAVLGSRLERGLYVRDCVRCRTPIAVFAHDPMRCVVPGAPSSRINLDSDESACQMAIFRAISVQSVSGTLVLRMRRKRKAESAKINSGSCTPKRGRWAGRDIALTGTSAGDCGSSSRWRRRHWSRQSARIRVPLPPGTTSVEGRIVAIVAARGAEKLLGLSFVP